MTEVVVLSEEEHKEYREAWVQVQLAHSGAYYTQGDAARAFRKFSIMTKMLCDHYEVPEGADYEIDVDRGLLEWEE